MRVGSSDIVGDSVEHMIILEGHLARAESWGREEVVHRLCIPTPKRERYITSLRVLYAVV